MGFNTCHIVPQKQLTHIVEMVISSTTLTKETQNRTCTYPTTPFQSSNTACEQQGSHHRGSPRSNNWFYGTSSHEYQNNVFHNSSIISSNQETSPHARSTIYEGNLLPSVMIEQTIIQEALLSMETFDGTQSKSKAWTESIENTAQISGQKQCV